MCSEKNFQKTSLLNTNMFALQEIPPKEFQGCFYNKAQGMWAADQNQCATRYAGVWSSILFAFPSRLLNL